MDNLLRPELPSISSVLRRLTRLAERGSVRAAVAEEWALDAASTAQERLVSESVLGKLVLRPSVADGDAGRE
jgi:NADPH:quinone reductase-like Zn-dependent oxidoreductase